MSDSDSDLPDLIDDEGAVSPPAAKPAKAAPARQSSAPDATRRGATASSDSVSDGPPPLLVDGASVDEDDEEEDEDYTDISEDYDDDYDTDEDEDEYYDSDGSELPDLYEVPDLEDDSDDDSDDMPGLVSSDDEELPKNKGRPATPPPQKAPQASKFDQKVEALKAKGNVFYTQREYASALEQYNKAIDLHSGNHANSSSLPILYCNVAAVKIQMKDWVGARHSADDAIRAKGDYAKAYFRKATAQIGLGDLDAAAATVKDCRAKCDTTTNDFKVLLKEFDSKLKEAKAKATKAAPTTASKAAPKTAPAPKARVPVSDDDDMPGLVSSDDEAIKPQPAKPPQQPQPAQSSAKKPNETKAKTASKTTPATKAPAPVSDDDDMPGLVSSDDEAIKPQPAKPPQQPQTAQSSAKKPKPNEANGKTAPKTTPAPKAPAPVSDDDDVPVLVSSDEDGPKPPPQPQPVHSSNKRRKVDAPQAAKAAPKPAPAPKAQASVSGDDDDDVPTLINDDEDPKTQAYKPQTKPAESSAPGAKQLREQGNEAYRAGEYEQALKHYQECVSKYRDDPDNYLVYSNMSASHLKLGERHKALNAAESCLALNENFVKGYFRKIEALRELGWIDEAWDTVYECEQYIATTMEDIELEDCRNKLRKLEAKKPARKPKDDYSGCTDPYCDHAHDRFHRRQQEQQAKRDERKQKKKTTNTPVAPVFASVNEQALRQQHAREQKSMTKEEREKKRREMAKAQKAHEIPTFVEQSQKKAARVLVGRCPGPVVDGKLVCVRQTRDLWNDSVRWRMLCSAQCRPLYHRECLESLLKQRGKTIGNACTHGQRTPCLTPDCWGIIDALYTEGGVRMEFRREETDINKEKEARRAAHEAKEKAKSQERERQEVAREKGRERRRRRELQRQQVELKEQAAAAAQAALAEEARLAAEPVEKSAPVSAPVVFQPKERDILMPVDEDEQRKYLRKKMNRKIAPTLEPPEPPRVPKFTTAKPELDPQNDEPKPWIENPTFEPEEGYHKVVINRRKEDIDLEHAELLEKDTKHKKKKDKQQRKKKKNDGMIIWDQGNAGQVDEFELQEVLAMIDETIDLLEVDIDHYDTGGHGSTVLLITNIEPLYGVEEVLRKISLDHPQEIVPVTCVGGPARDLPNKCIMCYFTDEDHAVDAFLSLNRQMVQGHKIMSYLLFPSVWDEYLSFKEAVKLSREEQGYVPYDPYERDLYDTVRYSLPRHHQHQQQAEEEARLAAMAEQQTSPISAPSPAMEALVHAPPFVATGLLPTQQTPSLEALVHAPPFVPTGLLPTQQTPSLEALVHAPPFVPAGLLPTQQTPSLEALVHAAPFAPAGFQTAQQQSSLPIRSPSPALEALVHAPPFVPASFQQQTNTGPDQQPWSPHSAPWEEAGDQYEATGDLDVTNAAEADATGEYERDAYADQPLQDAPPEHYDADDMVAEAAEDTDPSLSPCPAADDIAGAEPRDEVGSEAEEAWGDDTGAEQRDEAGSEAEAVWGDDTGAEQRDEAGNEGETLWGDVTGAELRDDVDTGASWAETEAGGEGEGEGESLWAEPAVHGTEVADPLPGEDDEEHDHYDAGDNASDPLPKFASTGSALDEGTLSPQRSPAPSPVMSQRIADMPRSPGPVATSPLASPAIGTHSPQLSAASPAASSAMHADVQPSTEVSAHSPFSAASLAIDISNIAQAAPLPVLGASPASSPSVAASAQSPAIPPASGHLADYEDIDEVERLRREVAAIEAELAKLEAERQQLAAAPDAMGANVRASPAQYAAPPAAQYWMFTRDTLPEHLLYDVVVPPEGLSDPLAWWQSLPGDAPVWVNAPNTA